MVVNQKESKHVSRIDDQIIIASPKGEAISDCAQGWMLSF